MFEFCLLVLLWTVDPNIVERSARNVAEPISTCARPPVRVIDPSSDHVSSRHRVTDEREIAVRLRRWERATRDTPAWSRSQQEEFRSSIQRDFNEHTTVAAEQFVGLVNLKWLNETYNWRILERSDHRVILEAIPRDETERLFYGSFRISLSANDGSPDSIVLTGRNQNQQTIWKSDRQPNTEVIHLARFENDVPPAPRLLLRTANARVD